MPVAKKERTNHKCLWQRKKEQTTNAGGKRRKIASLINQQTADTIEMNETKQLKPPQNPKRLPTCKHKVEKHTKNKQTVNPPNHNSLIDYCLQKRSGRLQS